jgi:hypothetical protein
MLKLCNLFPKPCSTFYTAEWRDLLSRVDEFELDLWGDHDSEWHGDGRYHALAAPGYRHFIAQSNDFFFANLKSVKRISFAAHGDNPIGLTGGSHVAMPFKPTDMPELVNLELKNCFIDHSLITLVRSHGQQLRSLRLEDCFAGKCSGV